MKKMFISILLLAVVCLSGCTEIREAKVLLPHSWVDMKKVSSHLYVENNMSKENVKKIEKAIPKAKSYVADIYGDVRTQPIIYACQSELCAQSFGLEGKIKGVRLLGHLILTKRDGSYSKELISHEWSHEELYERIGGFYHWYREIPLWFDEGLASVTMHQYRRYDEHAWKMIITKHLPCPKKEELVTMNQWRKANHKYLTNRKINVPYAVARNIVSMWYKKRGRKGLVELLDGIRKGKHFDELYED